MHIFGKLPPVVEQTLKDLVSAQESLTVVRSAPARSSMSHPRSTDLEDALVPWSEDHGFQHHVLFSHPRTGERFEYDFWREDEGVALEIMGYRADDEIYKDVLKFHVHRGTRVGIVLVPRYKWISGRRTENNFSATLKALAFADTYLNVSALVAIAYDWKPACRKNTWLLEFPGTAK